MSGKSKIKPTEAELEILNILWEHGAATVRFVNDELNRHKNVGYTTTLKIMQIMFDKKLVKRDSAGRSHVYRPATRPEKMQGMLLDHFLESAFGGSASKLVLQALGHHKASKDELRRIRELLDELEREEK